MKENLKNSYVDVDEFFAAPPTTNQKAWGLLNEFYHLVLTYMEKNNITKADLAARLGKSRSAMTQLFNKTPNISLKRVAEIADAIGIEISFASNAIESQKPLDKSREIRIVFSIHPEAWHHDSFPADTGNFRNIAKSGRYFTSPIRINRAAYGSYIQ